MRVFTVYFDSPDAVIKRVAVLKLELAVEVDLDEVSALRPLYLVKLVPSVPAGALGRDRFPAGDGAAGGSARGAVVELPVPGKGVVTFVYAADPEGNLIEIQAWS